MTNRKMIPKTYFTIALILLALMLMSSKCEKNNPEPKELELPPATQTGANTFGCKVNGQVYVPNGNLNYKPIWLKKYNEGTGKLRIYTLNIYDFNQKKFSPDSIEMDQMKVNLYIDQGAYGNGVYSGFGNNTSTETFSFYAKDVQPGNQGIFEYKIDSNSFNQITITRLDIPNAIVSGVFDFTGINSTLQDTVKITEGRFDISNLTIE